MRLESLEARIVVHEKNEDVYEEDNAFLKYNVLVKDISIKDLKNQLENDLKENEDLELKLEKFETSSKNLTKLINSQISAIDKTSLGYDSQMNESDLNNIHVNESEVLNNVVDSCKSDRNDNQVSDRFKISEGYHTVPPPYTGNYMPPKADLSFVGLDNSIFKSKVSETITSVPNIEKNASKTSRDSLEKPKTVRPSALLLEEWESDSEDENVFKPKKVKKTVKPSLKKIEFVNARSTTVENENKAEKPRKFSQSPRGRFNFRRTSLTGFPAQSISSSNAIALDSPNLLVLITGMSQSRQHVDTSLIHLESRKLPTTKLFDVDSGRIFIHHCEY
nr:hypothetical protein [Tanacetum cinerariifolium]